MSSDGERKSFWTSTNGILTGVVVLLTAGACLLFVLLQAGVFGDDGSGAAAPDPGVPASPSATSTPSTTTSETAAAPQSSGPGSPSEVSGSQAAFALAGTWTGTATSADGDFDVVLTVEPTCAMRKPCGSIHVTSLPCTGRVRLWTVTDTTYEFYVDQFSDDSSRDCSPGDGELFERVDDTHLRYTTDYSDAVGLLQRG